MCYTTKHKELLILCEYMCQRRQQGVKRDEWVSDLDFVDPAIGCQVQVGVVELSIDAFEWQAALAPFTEKP